LIPFLAYDPSQEYPALYPNGFGGLTRFGGGAFDGTANVTVLTPTTITVDTLPVGFTVSEGDLVELKQSTEVYGLFRSMSTYIANASGLTTITVEPTIKFPTIFTDAAVANFYRPSCVMIPIPESWSYTPEASSFPGASFEAIQKPF
jgi:hypothetical protein